MLASEVILYLVQANCTVLPSGGGDHPAILSENLTLITGFRKTECILSLKLEQGRDVRPMRDPLGTLATK